MMHDEFDIRTCAKQMQIDDADKSILFVSHTSFVVLLFRHRPDMIFFCISHKHFLFISIFSYFYFHIAVGDGKSKYDLHCQ